MRAPRLAESADQGGVRSFEEYQRNLHAVPIQALIHGRKLADRSAFADVHPHRGALDAALGQAAEIGKLGDQINRQVIYAVVAQIFEGFEDGTLS